LASNVVSFRSKPLLTLARLRVVDKLPAKALEFTILTAATPT
jgi:hypothetical protein